MNFLLIYCCISDSDHSIHTFAFCTFSREQYPLQTFHLSVQNVSDQLLVALQAVYLSSVGLNKVIQVQVQLWPAVHDVRNNLSQRKPLLSPCCMLVRLVVTVQELDNKLIQLEICIYE